MPGVARKAGIACVSMASEDSAKEGGCESGTTDSRGIAHVAGIASATPGIARVAGTACVSMVAVDSAMDGGSMNRTGSLAEGSTDVRSTGLGEDWSSGIVLVAVVRVASFSML